MESNSPTNMIVPKTWSGKLTSKPHALGHSYFQQIEQGKFTKGEKEVKKARFWSMPTNQKKIIRTRTKTKELTKGVLEVEMTTDQVMTKVQQPKENDKRKTKTNTIK